MRAITFTHCGGPEVLTFSDVPEPIPSSEQLLVRVIATALNRADLLQRRGKYPPPSGESNILGLEISGEVTKLGDKVTHFKVGDRVCGLVGSGSYAEYCLIDHQVAMPIPEGFSFVEAAAISEAFLTANEALFTLGNLQPNETVLIHAGGSGVGTAAIQLAKQVGAKIFTTVSSQEKMTKVKTLGADHIINYKKTDFAEEIPKESGVDVIIDFIGASYLARHLQILKSGGRLVCVGLMGGTQAEINLEVLLRKQLQIKGLIMRARSIADKRKMTQHFIAKWLPLFVKRELQPVIDTVFPFDEAQAAHAYMESNANVGKIVLEME